MGVYILAGFLGMAPVNRFEGYITASKRGSVRRSLMVVDDG